MPKRKIVDATQLSNEQLALQGIEFTQKKAAIKELDSQCKEIRVPLEAAIDSSGRTLPTGSKVLVVTYADKDVHLKKTLRVGKVLLPEAMDVLIDNGFEEAIEKVPTIREDVIERLYEEGKISDELLSKIYVAKPSYAFSVDVKQHYDGPEE